MNKVPLSDNSGRWFDIDSAKRWDEGIDEFEEQYRKSQGPPLECLYLTRNGSFILCQILPNGDGFFSSISTDAGAAWLISHGHQSELVKLELAVEERKLEM